MSIESAIGLFTVLFVLAVVPGPSDFMVAARAVSSGLRQAAMMIAGILLADLILIGVVVFSLEQLGHWLGDYMELMKYPAGGLLLGFGAATLRSRRNKVASTALRNDVSSFLSGFLITLGDPKALLFYFGLLPAFVELENVGRGDLLALFLIITLLICGVKGTYAWLAQKGGQLFWGEKGRLVLNTLAGCILIATGLYLIIR